MTIRIPSLVKTTFNEWSDTTEQVKLKIETANNSLKLGQPWNNGDTGVLSQRTAVLVVNGCTDAGQDVLLARVIIKYQIPNRELPNGVQKLINTPPITNQNGNGPITVKWSDNDIKDTISYVINTLFSDNVWKQP